MKNNKEYLDKVVSIIEIPYFYNMENYGVDDIDDQKYVLEKVYGFDISFFTNSNYRCSDIYDSKGNIIYYENSTYGWYKKEYDEYGNLMYYENCDGYFENYR